MKAIIFVAFVTVFLISNSLTLAKYTGTDEQLHWWDTDDNNEYQNSGQKRIPFPQCLLSKSGSKLFGSSSFQKLFDKKLQEEEDYLKKEGYSNYENGNEGTYDYDSTELRRGTNEGRTAARAALKVTRDILTVLMCELNGTNTDNLQNILNKFNIPNEFCSYLDKPDCSSKSVYRTITGVCNNLKNPYFGSSQTAFKRNLPAAYDDHLSEPRRRSVKGGYLPSCRYISLSLGSRAIFNRNYNNFFVSFGQVIAHDVALSVPVSDTYSRPISSCSCGDKYDSDKCNVIPISPDDPYLRGQKCMAFPATAQAFKNQVCSLGVKEHMNGNTHFLDLSILYGSTTRTAEALRSEKGLLKSSRFQWSKYELPPGQREGKSCTDATSKRKCFAGGDSRLMINLLFTGIHTIFLRIHNEIARYFQRVRTDWSSDKIYEETRIINIAFFQRLIYKFYLPILLGESHVQKVFGDSRRTAYNETADPSVNTEFSTAAFRLHSLVRDLFTRCSYDGKIIDTLWLHDIHHKAKFAYDVEHNGLDSLLCGAFFDYGFAFDSNFAHQIHHRLFESGSQYNQLWRNDLVSINICRGREHGIPSYNELLKFCSFPKAEEFSGFGNTLNTDGIAKLSRLYRSPDDVDAFVGLNFEDPHGSGILGRVGSCIVTKQFLALRDGDRFFYTHNTGLTDAQLDFVNNYPIYCLFCRTIDIQKLPQNIFKLFSDPDNPLVDCKVCQTIPLEPPIIDRDTD